MTATHPARLGRDMLLKIEDNGTYVTVAGLRTKSIRLNSQSVDVTDQGSEGWTELLPDAGIRSMSVTGSGVFRDADTDERARQLFFDGEAPNFQVVIPDFGIVEGPFQVTSIEYGGSHNGEATYELSLASAGALSFTAI